MKEGGEEGWVEEGVDGGKQPSKGWVEEGGEEGVGGISGLDGWLHQSASTSLAVCSLVSASFCHLDDY